MPTGRITCNVHTDFVWKPKAPNTSTQESIKKLKYLKNPSIPKLKKILTQR